jgi:ribosomal-protein-alanine N-acetyltransferase
MNTQTIKAVPHLRWMIRRDMPEVLDIEERCFGVLAWGEEGLIKAQRSRTAIGMVAERDERVVGHMIYELTKKRLIIQRFAVHPGHQRTGVGRAMVGKLVSKLAPERRERIIVEVRETELGALKFFKAMHFKATAILREYFADTLEDAYRMERIYQRLS